MIELISNPVLLNSLKENGREFGINRSWNQIFDGLLDVYQQVLENRVISIQSA
jgi:hypothetical protein